MVLILHTIFYGTNKHNILVNTLLLNSDDDDHNNYAVCVLCTVCNINFFTARKYKYKYVRICLGTKKRVFSSSFLSYYHF